jgi:small-conductance mechanosensitive channel
MTTVPALSSFELLSAALYLSPWRQRALATTTILLAAAAALIGLRWAKAGLLNRLVHQRDSIKPIRFRNLQLLSPLQRFELVRNSLTLAHLIFSMLVIAGALLAVTVELPVSRGYVLMFFGWIWEPLRRISLGIVGYLPEFLSILVILFVLRVALRVVKFVFDHAERGNLSLEPWVHREVARPTGTIVRSVLVVLAMFFVVPLLPGIGTAAAQGLTVVLGLMVSFGSTTTVGNLVAGVVLAYMRPFRNGDWVRIGDCFGEVLESRFLYVRLRTIKNEEVIVPSLQALSANIQNFSSRATERGLILHTTVTIGYSAPWKTVHELLICAARKISFVLQEPKPFVWQTALNDFFVTYEINAYTNRPDQIYEIYAELHRNIQDTFNEGGIEIMSPHYTQIRDGNHVTIPASYLPKDYQAPRLRVETAP